jgi:polyhydroxybutyrate depolymerase
MRLLAGLLLVLALPVVGCGSSGLGSCDIAAPEPCATRSEVQVGGSIRRYIVASRGGDATVPRALVVVLHPLGGGGQQIRTQLGLGLEHAAGQEAVMVYPDGLHGQWDTSLDGIDVALFDALLERVSAQVAIDRTRIFVAGFSMGSSMSNTLGCVRGDVIRGIAPLSGMDFSSDACVDVPVPAWIANGGQDAPPGGWNLAEWWRSRNGCAATRHAVPGPSCVAWDDCGANPVVFCEFNGGHVVQSWEAPAIWSFFRALPLR